MKRPGVILALASLLGWLGCVTNPAVAAAAAASPTVTGPVIGGNGVPYFVQDLLVGFVDLAALGYEQSEFFITGTANAYASIDPLSPDGKWSVAPSGSAAYTTRVVVYRPVNPRRFNGTVVLEWLNVSGQFDAKPDWVHTHTELLRDGFVYMAVSAQEVGVGTTKAGDPARYGPLSHPGDSFSYDILSQAGQAVHSSSALLLGGLTPKRVLAMGESQSASRLVTYINAVHPLVDVFDGYLVHSRGARGAPLSQSPLPAFAVPAPTPIRDDLDTPVLVFMAETDVFNSDLGVRQPDTDRYRLWEVAGTAHFDAYGLVFGYTDTGDGEGEIAALATMQNPPSSPPPGVFECDLPINTGPMHWVMNAALYRLNRWVVRGDACAGCSASSDDCRVARGVRDGCLRQHVGRRSHTAGRCPHRHVDGHRQQRTGAVRPVLRCLRHDRAVHGEPARSVVRESRAVRHAVASSGGACRECGLHAPT